MRTLSLGRSRKFEYPQVQVLTIRPAESLGPILGFDQMCIRDSAEGAKFELVIYNLPEDAQRLAVNLSGEKNDNIQVTDALRDANGNITLEIGSTAYPFKALSQPGEHTVRVTYQDGAGAWPQIGEVGSLTVKPATPVLSSSEDTISSGDGYTLTFTDDVKNEYGVTYEYAFPVSYTHLSGEARPI